MDITVLVFVLLFVFAILYSWILETQSGRNRYQLRIPFPDGAIAHATTTANADVIAHANPVAHLAAILRANSLARANAAAAAATAITDVVLQVPENFQQPDTTASTTTTTTTTTDVVIEVLENSQQKSEEELKSLKKECVICLDEFDEALKANTIPLSCGHMFHRVCIHQWLKTQKTCPICRASVLSHQFNSNTSE